MAEPMPNLMDGVKSILAGYAPELDDPQMMLPASDYFDLAGEEFGRRLLLTEGADGQNYCFRPDFTLPIAKAHVEAMNTGSAGAASPVTRTYFGKIFRQRTTGPTESTQAGLEVLGGETTQIEQVLNFALSTIDASGFKKPAIRMGSVALFEKLLAECGVPDVWQPRFRSRLGNVEAMEELLDRLSTLEPSDAAEVPNDLNELVASIEQKMLASGLSIYEGRTPTEIAQRFAEKEIRRATLVPPQAISCLRDYLNIKTDLSAGLAQVEQIAKAANIDIAQEVAAIQKAQAIVEKNAPRAKLIFDGGFAPRLHFYTGLVFEVLSEKQSEVIVSGGEYDRLLSALGAAQACRACGAAVWMERLSEVATDA